MHSRETDFGNRLWQQHRHGQHAQQLKKRGRIIITYKIIRKKKNRERIILSISAQ